MIARVIREKLILSKYNAILRCYASVNDERCIYMNICIGSVSINRIPVGPVRVLTAQQLGAFSNFRHFGGLGSQGHVGQI